MSRKRNVFTPYPTNLEFREWLQRRVDRYYMFEHEHAQRAKWMSGVKMIDLLERLIAES